MARGRSTRGRAARRCRPGRAQALVLLVLVGVLTASCGASVPGIGQTSGGRVPIYWFVGLGTGSQPEQIEVQARVVQAFNESHPDIELIVEFVDNEVAADTLAGRIADGDPPDIIGPVGIKGSNAFAGQFLDLQPLVDETGFDLSAYDQQQVSFWRQDGKLVALPFGVFPSFIYYNTELFDRAGLAHPPQRFGETYVGEPWTMERLARLAQLLTLDSSGRPSTNPDFDPDSVVQFGFHHQWGEDARAQGAFFGPGSLVAPDGSAQIPPNWLDEWQWYHDLMFTAHAAPTADDIANELFDEDNTFTTGNTAMVFSHLWYTCCIRNPDDSGRQFWDVAVVPEYDGVQTSKLHADIFRILASTEHPREAFEVVAYLVTDAAAELLAAYGSMPARIDLQDRFFAELDQTYPQGVNWQVVKDSLAHPDLPSHEDNMPNFLEAEARIDEFEERLTSEADLDVPAAAEELRADLDVIFQSG